MSIGTVTSGAFWENWGGLSDMKERIKKKRKRRMRRKAFRLLLNLFLIVSGLFVVTFTVYFFNLDMKLTSMIEPFLLKHYDRIERNQHL